MLITAESPETDWNHTHDLQKIYHRAAKRLRSGRATLRKRPAFFTTNPEWRNSQDFREKRLGLGAKKDGCFGRLRLCRLDKARSLLYEISNALC